MNNIRQLTKDEYPKAIELSWQVFTITGKEDFNNEGLEFFKSFIYNKKYINEIIFYGSFDNEALTGILGIKSNGKHISLFFIKPEYHRHGLGKKLFHYASILPLKQRLILLLMLFLSTRVWDLLRLPILSLSNKCSFVQILRYSFFVCYFTGST